MNAGVKRLISQIDKTKLRTNVQRALYQLLCEDWVARGSFRIPNATSRIRDLRKARFGSLHVECADAKTVGRRSRRARQTYYRLRPSLKAIRQVLKGVIN